MPNHTPGARRSGSPEIRTQLGDLLRPRLDDLPGEREGGRIGPAGLLLLGQPDRFLLVSDQRPDRIPARGGRKVPGEGGAGGGGGARGGGEACGGGRTCGGGGASVRRGG